MSRWAPDRYNVGMDQPERELDPGVLESTPGGAVAASVIWLHGLGADGHDFVPIIPELKLPRELQVRFLFPHAPIRPVSINAGMRMRAWFDLTHLDFETGWDERGVEESMRRLEGLVQREQERGIPRSSLMVVGFSQGGALALEYLRRHGAGLAGIVALSTFHPAAVAGLDTAPEGAPPVFGAHGLSDPVVPYALGKRTRDAFVAAGYRIEWHSYPMAHQVIGEEMQALGRWMARCFGDRNIGASA